jgi:hypothetical protein
MYKPFCNRVAEAHLSETEFMPFGGWLGDLLSHRLIIIRLCMAVPFAGGRVLETGDEELLKFASRTGGELNLSLADCIGHLWCALSAYSRRLHQVRHSD